MNIFAEAARLEEEKRPFALAQIIGSRGSIPRHSAQMLVIANGDCIGTVGGGSLERQVIEQAISAIAERKGRVFDCQMAENEPNTVNDNGGQTISVYIGVHGLPPHLVLIDAERVNRADTTAGKPSGFDIHLADIYPTHLASSPFPVGADLLQVRNPPAGGLMKHAIKFNREKLVVIRGAGDIATGVALRLHHAGFKIVMLDVAQPTAIRRTVAFAQAIFDGKACVEGVTAQVASDTNDAFNLLCYDEIPVLIDENAQSLEQLRPHFLVDAILAKQNLGTHRNMAPITVALGPGFNAGQDCDAVIETNRGHNLGRVIYRGYTHPNTGIPGSIGGHTLRRVIRAPADGVMTCRVALGDLVEEGDIVAYCGEVPVITSLSGMVRGLLHNGIETKTGHKIGDIDPRGIQADHTTVSDKARAIGGAVLEAIMKLRQR